MLMLEEKKYFTIFKMSQIQQSNFPHYWLKPKLNNMYSNFKKISIIELT